MLQAMDLPRAVFALVVLTMVLQDSLHVQDVVQECSALLQENLLTRIAKSARQELIILTQLLPFVQYVQWEDTIQIKGVLH